MAENIDIRHVAKLARLHVDEEQIPKFEREMAEIVGMVEQLPDFENAQLTLDPNDRMTLRDDEVGSSLTRGQVLKNAPKTEAGCVVVPRVVEE